MLAARFEGEGRLVVTDQPMPILEHDDDVLIRVSACGICGTDLHILAVPPAIPIPPGVILGHEYTGVVVGTGNALGHLQPGQTVVVEPTLTCGVCDYCRLGLPNSCLATRTIGITRHGGMAEYSVVPARALHPIQADIPPALASLVEPLACVLNGADKVKLQPGETALVLGAGPIGLLFVHLLRAAGASHIIVSEIAPYRRDKATEAGADLVVDPRQDDVVARVREVTRLGVDVVVDAVGTQFDVAIQAARRGGRVLLFGFNRHALPPIPQGLITRHELTIYGSFLSAGFFPRAIRLIETGRPPLNRLVTHLLPLAEAATAVALLQRGEGVKAVLLT